MTDPEWLDWGFKCDLCGERLHARYWFDKPRVGRVTIEIKCLECGAGGTLSQPAELVDYPPRSTVPVERAGFYERLTCAVCGRILRGRQRLFCSDRCRKRYSRIADKRGHKSGHSRTISE